MLVSGHAATEGCSPTERPEHGSDLELDTSATGAMRFLILAKEKYGSPSIGRGDVLGLT